MAKSELERLVSLGLISAWEASKVRRGSKDNSHVDTRNYLSAPVAVTTPIAAATMATPMSVIMDHIDAREFQKPKGGAVASTTRSSRARTSRRARVTSTSANPPAGTGNGCASQTAVGLSESPVLRERARAQPTSGGADDWFGEVSGNKRQERKVNKWTTLSRSMVRDTEFEIMAEALGVETTDLPNAPSDDIEGGDDYGDVEGWDGEPLDPKEIAARNLYGDPDGNGQDRPLQYEQEVAYQAELQQANEHIAQLQAHNAELAQRADPQLQARLAAQREEQLVQMIANPEQAARQIYEEGLRPVVKPATSTATTPAWLRLTANTALTSNAPMMRFRDSIQTTPLLGKLSAA